jgi:hypothetical protein
MLQCTLQKSRNLRNISIKNGGDPIKAPPEQTARSFVWQLHFRDAIRKNIFKRRHIPGNTSWICHTVPGTESVSMCQQHSTAWWLLIAFRSQQILSAVSLIFPSLLRQTDRHKARLTPQNHAIISSGRWPVPVTSAIASSITTLPLPLHNRHNFTQAKETKWESNRQGMTFTKTKNGIYGDVKLVWTWGLPLLHYRFEKTPFLCTLWIHGNSQCARKETIKLSTVIMQT